MEQTFQINITSRENSTWQGTLITEQGKVAFQSELELLGEIGRMMEKEKMSDLKWNTNRDKSEKIK